MGLYYIYDKDDNLLDYPPFLTEADAWDYIEENFNGDDIGNFKIYKGDLWLLRLLYRTFYWLDTACVSTTFVPNPPEEISHLSVEAIEPQWKLLSEGN